MINRFDAETWTVEEPFQVNRCHRPTQLLMPVAVSGQGGFTLGDRETVDSPESVSDDLRLLNEVQVGGPPSLTGTFAALRLTSRTSTRCKSWSGRYAVVLPVLPAPCRRPRRLLHRSGALSWSRFPRR